MEQSELIELKDLVQDLIEDDSDKYNMMITAGSAELEARTRWDGASKAPEGSAGEDPADAYAGSLSTSAIDIGGSAQSAKLRSQG